jgi:hypothetical protein
MLGAAAIIGCSAPDTGVRAASATQADLNITAECFMERELLDVATDAFLAQTGAPATSQSALVDHKLLRQTVSGVDIHNGEVVRVAAQVCRKPLQPDAQTSARCATALMRLTAAAAMFERQKGFPPASSIELGAAGFNLDAQLYEWNGGNVTPVAGETCPAGSIHQPDAATLCRAEYKIMETSIEAYQAMNGGWPTTEADLVTAGLLRTEIVNFDFVVTSDLYQVVAVGDRCADFDPSNGAGRAVNCEVDRKTVETAVEAFTSNTGSPPVTQDDLVPDYLRQTSRGFEVSNGAVTPVAGICS